MSIIDIQNRITNKDHEFSEYCYSDRSLIYTDAKKEDLDKFSFELKVGAGWALKYSENETQLITIPEEGIKIPGHGSVVIEAKELIKLPHNLYGIIVPTGSLFLSKGILIAPAKIEPSFQGKLKLRLFNTTSQSYMLKRESKLASAIFFPTAATVHNQPILRFSDIATIKDSRLKSVGRWATRNHMQLISWGITILFSSVVSTTATYFLYYKP